MANIITLISELTEKSTNVCVWEKVLRVWQTTIPLNLKEKHLIFADPNISSM